MDSLSFQLWALVLKESPLWGLLWTTMGEAVWQPAKEGSRHEAQR